MYDWHICEINGKSNIKWLHNCLYNTLQIMIYINFIYYAFYIMLCGNSVHKFMFYLYYMKYVKKNNITHFCYINLNVPDLIKD